MGKTKTCHDSFGRGWVSFSLKWSSKQTLGLLLHRTATSGQLDYGSEGTVEAMSDASL